MVACVSWSPDGSKIASGSEDTTLRVWDAETGAPLRELKVDDEVRIVSWSPDSSRIAAMRGRVTSQ
jgi:WD40 repeat protein